MKNDLAKIDLADELYAGRAASAIISQFMQRPPDYGVMLNHLTKVLIGLPKPIVSRMADPRLGVAASNEFFSLAIVHEWLETNAPKPAFKPFKPAVEDDWTPPTPEQRDACIERARQAQEVMRETTEKMRSNGRIVGKRAPNPYAGKLTPTQVDDPDKRMVALKNLEEMNRRGAPTPKPQSNHDGR